MKRLDLAVLLGVPDMPEHLVRVEAGLGVAIAAANGPLRAPLTRLLGAHGKRLRPALAIAAAQMCGAKIDQTVINSAVAVELLHLASLVHDDIIDHAATRWNVPTISALEGADTAILAGDFLFARACTQAAAVSGALAALVAGVFGDLCIAEMQELADQYNVERIPDSLAAVIHGKTARLLGAACQAGGFCAASSPAMLQALTRYGEAFGMAFQYIDDVLDFLGDPQVLGKPTGTDVRDGVYTLPVIFGLAGDHGPHLRELLKNKPEPAKVTELLLQTDAFERTIETARIHAGVAGKALNIPGQDGQSTQASSKTLAALQNFPVAYLDWSLKTLLAVRHQPAVMPLTK